MVKESGAPADEQRPVVTFSRLSEHAYAFCAGSDPTSGVVVGNDGVLLVDAQPTPELARAVLEKVRSVTDKPIRHVVLSSHRAVRTLGASLYDGAQVICSEATRELIVERGAVDWKVQRQRFPRLFADSDSIPGLTHPSLTFGDRLSLWLGRLQVDVLRPGRGHTRGDAVVWLPEERSLFAGDLVADSVMPDASEGHLQDWPQTIEVLRALHPAVLLPGRGEPVRGEAAIEQALDATRDCVATLWTAASASAAAGLAVACAAARIALQPVAGERPLFDALLPFGVARALDEARGLDHPRLWTAEREHELRQALEA